jgi:hypothetical protein
LKIRDKYIGIEVLTAVVMKSSIFWDITPCSTSKAGRRFGGICLHHQGLLPTSSLVSCLAYYLTLKMEATCSSETSVDFQRTTLHYIPKNIILQAINSYKMNGNPKGKKPWRDQRVDGRIILK